MKKYSIKINQIYNMDCRFGMKLIKDEKVDNITTDPPFAINFKSKKANYNRKEKNVLPGYVEIPPEEYEEFTETWIKQATRILKPTGSMFIFSGTNHLATILNAVKNNNLTLVNLIPWHYQFGVYAKRKFIASHYEIIFCCKNDKKRKFYTDSRFSTTKEQYNDMLDVWKIQREYWSGKLKPPTKLPYEVIEKILQYTTQKNDIVFDPFLGSGQVAFVAQQLKRKYMGFEIAKNYWKFASQRLK